MEFDSIFQSRQTVSRDISNQAREFHQQLTDLIKEPVNNQSITLSPDLWTDRYKQLSYLGITATFIDFNLKFRKLVLCCRCFPVDLPKTGENISKVRKQSLMKNATCLTNFRSSKKK